VIIDPPAAAATNRATNNKKEGDQFFIVFIGCNLKNKIKGRRHNNTISSLPILFSSNFTINLESKKSSPKMPPITEPPRLSNLFNIDSWLKPFEGEICRRYKEFKNKQRFIEELVGSGFMDFSRTMMWFNDT
jgi:hypothetical protein